MPSTTTPQAFSHKRTNLARPFAWRGVLSALIPCLILSVTSLWGGAGALPITSALAASKAEIDFENRDGLPFNDRLVMNRIETPEDGTHCYYKANDPTCYLIPPNVVHDTATLRVYNHGTDPLELSGVVEGPWTIQGSPTLPQQSVAPGAFLDIPVTFVAQVPGPRNGLYEGTLTLNSNDSDEPTTVVQLAGFWQSMSENLQEPSLKEIIQLYGYNISLSKNGRINHQGLIEMLGDEVLSPYWRRADTSIPVRVQQLAAYHRQGGDATVYWFQKDTSTTRYIFTHEEVEGQTVLPHLNNSTALAAGTFTPRVNSAEAVFGFKVDGEWSDPSRNDANVDIANGCPGPCGHHMRFWPVRDRSGVIMQDAWLMSMDYSGINYDYQDNVYLITNIRPENEAVNASSPGLLPGSPGLVFEFDRDYPGSLADKDGQTIGFTRTQPNSTDRLTTTTSYNPSLLDIDPSGQGTLKITTSVGSNRGTENALVNGVLVPFDARTQRYAMTTRLIGPLTNITDGSRQGGLMLGYNQDNFIKLVALASTNGPVIEFAMEQETDTPVLGVKVPLASPATIQSLDLMLYGDPTTGTVRAAYRVITPSGDTGEVPIAQPFTLTGVQRARFFGRNVGGGLLTTHKGTTSPITLTFDRFTIENRETAPTGTSLYRIDTGTGPGKTVLSGWSSDAVPTKLYRPTTAPDEPASVSNVEIANTDNDQLYRTYRGNVGNNMPQATRILTYELPIAGTNLVDVRLHFAELYWGAPGGGEAGPGKRIFDVLAEGNTIIDDFDITAASGGVYTAVVVTLKGIPVNDNSLTLAFKADRNFASIAGIEVFASNEIAPTPTATATATATATMVPNLLALRVNFQNEAAPVPQGYVRDFGQGYGVRENSMSYGWVVPDTAFPIDLSVGGTTPGNGRDRNVNPSDQRLDTLMHMQANDITAFNGTGGEGAWEVAAPSGRYQVTVAVGDALKSSDVQTHTVNVEGLRAITDFVPTGNSGTATRHMIATVEVQVTDGRLTIDAKGGFNTKINYIDILSLSVPTATSTPTATTISTPTATATSTPTATATSTPTATATSTPTATTTPATATPATATPATATPANAPPASTPTSTTTLTTLTADAGADQNVVAGELVTLNGSSIDPTGQLSLTYEWRQVEGTLVQLSPAGPRATFIAPQVSQTLVFQFTVTNTKGESALDMVEVVVRTQQSNTTWQIWLPLVRTND